MAQLITAQLVAMSLLLIAVTISHFLPLRTTGTAPGAVVTAYPETPRPDVAKADSR
jgi:hypothetical protein